MATTSFRSDTVEQDLTFLGQHSAAPRSDIIRDAVREKAQRLREQLLREETRAMRDDPDELAELAAVREDLADARAW